jgi:two-component system response regulator RegX3
MQEHVGLTGFSVGFLEDDLNFAAQVIRDLKLMDCTIEHRRTGEDFLASVQEFTFDLCLFDLQLPDMSGLEVMRQLQTMRKMPPVIFLTASDTEENISSILLAGADDYIVKPHNPSILRARIESLLRRLRQQDVKLAPELLGALKIDYNAQQIFLDSELVNLTRTETILAFTLLQRRGQIVSRQVLYQALGLDSDVAVETRRLDVHISRIRSKLELNVMKSWKLSSVYQRGYRMEYFEQEHGVSG